MQAFQLGSDYRSNGARQRLDYYMTTGFRHWSRRQERHVFQQ